MTTKITSGSATGAGTSKGSTTGAGAAGFGAAGVAAGGGFKVGSSCSAIANAAGGGCLARRNLNATFPELRRTGQGAAKPCYLKQGPQGIMPGRTDLTELNLPVLRANYVCSENSPRCQRISGHVVRASFSYRRSLRKQKFVSRVKAQGG